MKTKHGFTLIELLVVIAIISTLATVVFAALRPSVRLAESRDARRSQDLGEILTAIHSCAVDKKDSTSLTNCLGTYTVDQTYEIVNVGTSSGCNTVCTSAASASSCLPLSTTLADYLSSLPKDPNNSVVGHTGYSITVKSNGMTVLSACAAENGPIQASR